MKTALKIILTFLFFFLFTSNVSAHQPYLVGQSQKIDVVDPEISKAYYGEMVGKPVFYVIDTKEPITLYVNILVPKLEGIDTDYIVEIYKERSFVKRLDSRKFEWKEFYEEYGGDYYLEGPEYRADVLPGLYTIIITSKDNFGKYALAIGEQEVFDSKEIVRTISVLPSLKKNYFGYSWSKLIMGRVGLIYGIPILLIVGTTLLTIKIIRGNKGKLKKSKK